jgi:cysteinyl-tRNA synthetase
MMLKVYNTMSRRKEAFEPLKKGQVGLYTCGPTVYSFAHIGNMRAYVFADILHRYLVWKGYRLKHVMNLTDVDDKTIRDSQKEGVSLKDFTERYTKLFFEDLKTLNIEPATDYPKATEHIAEMVKLVKALMDKGLAYKGKDAIYFSISKFQSYGRLAHLEKAQLKAGARVKQDEYDKEHAQDFALWKFWDEADGDVYWETELGKGRPGWHIECSAMSMKYLGPSFDIHTGGVDLIFPHHQNEIAQSEGTTGKQFVKYWMHNEHLLVDGQKMSKSAGNFYTLRDLLKKGHPPEAIRYLLLATHYRQKLNLTEDGLKAAGQAVARLQEFASRAKTGKDGPEMDGIAKSARKSFEAAMDDDLNTPLALSVVFDFIREANAAGAGGKAFGLVLDFDRILGLRLGEGGEWKGATEASTEIRKLLDEREAARKKKDWASADVVRNKLKEMGVLVEDSKNGPVWKKN